jgi:hypothetical protein
MAVEQAVEIRPDAAAEQQPSGGLPRQTRTRQGKVRLLTLDALDSRTAAAKAARRLIETLTVDMGRQLSAGERQLVQRAAMLGAVAGGYEARFVAGLPVVLHEYLAVTNVQRRVLATLGLRQRRESAPSLSAYLEQRSDEDTDELSDDVERS